MSILTIAINISIILLTESNRGSEQLPHTRLDSIVLLNSWLFFEAWCRMYFINSGSICGTFMFEAANSTSIGITECLPLLLLILKMVDLNKQNEQ